jgi:glycosyltransferase involved in cell wall biosynthesis
LNSLKTFPGGFCVLMALYGGDKPALFERAVHSIFSNTLLPDQYIIVIDGPLTKELQDLVLKLGADYPKIEFISLPKNVGLANALNVGLKAVRYKWVVRADSDDINLPQRFEKLAAILDQQPHLKLFGSAILEVDENDNPLTVRQVPSTEIELRQFARTRNPFNHMAVAYELESALACGSYPNIFLKEDYGLWCHFLANQFPVANTQEVLVHASAGMGMFRRRGGWRYAKSEWQMQNLLVQSGIKDRLRAVVDGILRATFFLIPPSIRGFIYVNFLRKSAEPTRQ